LAGCGTAPGATGCVNAGGLETGPVGLTLCLLLPITSVGS
jgi:hypothetical protein